MRLALIGCAVLTRHVGFLTATSKNNVHSFFLEQGLHNTPEKLQKKIKDTIDEIEKMQENTQEGDKKFDAIVLAYGLCSNGIIGLVSKTLPIIAPKCDDCMALFLGSQKKYLDIFHSKHGIYWYNKPWCENCDMPSKQRYERIYNSYLDEYDEDTADYLMESLYGWRENYEHACFIKSDIFDDEEEQLMTKEVCNDFNWNYFEAKEDLSFLKDLVESNWDERFVLCKAKHKIVADFSGNKIKSEPI